MRIGGKKVDYTPKSEILVFPREGGNDFGFRISAVMERTEFEKYTKTPTPPKKMIRGGNMVENYEDPRYLKAISKYNQLYLDWLVISSICAVVKDAKGYPKDEPIEWETVVKEDNATWTKWRDEFRKAGFTEAERVQIQNTVITVNSISDDRIKEARDSFLQLPDQEQEESSYPDSEPSDTPSGEPANDSESDHQ